MRIWAIETLTQKGKPFKRRSFYDGLSMSENEAIARSVSLAKVTGYKHRVVAFVEEPTDG